MSLVGLEIDSRVAVVTLNRAPVNALDESMVNGLTDVLDQIVQLSDIGAVLIRSALKRFCAGADIKMINTLLNRSDGEDRLIAFMERLQAVYSRIENLPQPTVVAIDGTAAGGGLELALACDLRVAGRDVRVGLPEAAIGLLPGAGGTQRLTRIAGRGVTLRTILTAELHSGEEAERLGIVQWAVANDQVQEFAAELARRLAAQSGPAAAAAKRCIALAPSPEGYRAELNESRGLLRDPSTRQLVEAFLSMNARTNDKGVTTS